MKKYIFVVFSLFLIVFSINSKASFSKDVDEWVNTIDSKLSLVGKGAKYSKKVLELYVNILLQNRTESRERITKILEMSGYKGNELTNLSTEIFRKIYPEGGKVGSDAHLESIFNKIQILGKIQKYAKAGKSLIEFYQMFEDFKNKDYENLSYKVYGKFVDAVGNYTPYGWVWKLSGYFDYLKNTPKKIFQKAKEINENVVRLVCEGGSNNGMIGFADPNYTYEEFMEESKDLQCRCKGYKCESETFQIPIGEGEPTFCCAVSYLTKYSKPVKCNEPRALFDLCKTKATILINKEKSEESEKEFTNSIAQDLEYINQTISKKPSQAVATTPQIQPQKPTSTPFPSPTSPLPSTQPTQPLPTPQPKPYDSASLTNESYPDSPTIPVFTQGQAFKKTWTLQNNGTTDWSGYKLVKIGGEITTETNNLSIPYTSKNNSVTLSVNMTAPSNPRTYTSDWQIKNANGEIIYVGKSPKIWAKIIVASPYKYQYVAQSLYLTLKRSETKQIWLKLKNTGSRIWYRDENNPDKVAVRLGACRDKDRLSKFATPSTGGWISDNRIQMEQSSVAPGQDALFTFNIYAAEKGSPNYLSAEKYTEYFCPVADGYAWMEDIGIYWEITIEEKTSSPTYHPPTTLQIPSTQPTQSVVATQQPSSPYLPTEQLFENAANLSHSVQQAQYRKYFFPVIADGRSYTISVIPLNGDPNLYISKAPNPTRDVNMGSSTKGMGMEDNITFTAPTDGKNYDQYVSVYGNVSANYLIRLTSTQKSTTSVVSLTENGPQVSGSVAPDTTQKYTFPVIADGRTYTVMLSPLSGDADLYISNNTGVSTSNYQYKSTNGGISTEQITFVPISGNNYTAYILVYGKSSSTYNIKVSSKLPGNWNMEVH